jgi:hypothetical protein
MSPRDDDNDFAAPPPQAQSNAAAVTLGILGIVIGVLAVLFSFIECLGMYAIYPGAVGAILSLIGILVAKGSRVLPIVGLVFCLASIANGYYQYDKWSKIAQEAKDRIEREAKKK